MKKTFAFALALILLTAVSLCGCGNTDTPQADPADDNTAVTTTATAAAGTNTEAAEQTDVNFDSDAEYVYFYASLDFQLESDAWIGLIPTGTIYENEVDADEQDITYAYCDNLGEDGAENYRFAFEKTAFYDIADGIYDLVLCSSDDAETGKVLLQIGLEKTGEKIVLDFENKQ